MSKLRANPAWSRGTETPTCIEPLKTAGIPLVVSNLRTSSCSSRWSHVNPATPTNGPLAGVAGVVRLALHPTIARAESASSNARLPLTHSMGARSLFMRASEPIVRPHWRHGSGLRYVISTSSRRPVQAPVMPCHPSYLGCAAAFVSPPTIFGPPRYILSPTAWEENKHCTHRA